MARSTSVRVVMNNFPKIIANLKQADQAVERAARNIETAAKVAAPVDTGRLQGSIHVESLGPAARAIGTDVEYATFVEFGTRHMAAQPFLIPAFEAEAPRLLAELKKLPGSGL